MEELTLPFIDVKSTLTHLRSEGVPKVVLDQLEPDLIRLSLAQLQTNRNMQSLLAQIEIGENTLANHRSQFLERFQERGKALKAVESEKSVMQSECEQMIEANKALREEFIALENTKKSIEATLRSKEEEIRELVSKVTKDLPDATSKLEAAQHDMARLTAENVQLHESLAQAGHDYFATFTVGKKGAYLSLECPIGKFHKPKLTIGIQGGEFITDHGLTTYLVQRSRAKYHPTFGVGMHSDFANVSLLTSGQAHVEGFGEGRFEFKLPIRGNSDGWELYSSYTMPVPKETTGGLQMKFGRRLFQHKMNEKPVALVRQSRTHGTSHHTPFAVVHSTASIPYAAPPGIKIPIMTALLVVGMVVTRFFQKKGSIDMPV